MANIEKVEMCGFYTIVMLHMWRDNTEREREQDDANVIIWNGSSNCDCNYEQPKPLLRKQRQKKHKYKKKNTQCAKMCFKCSIKSNNTYEKKARSSMFEHEQFRGWVEPTRVARNMDKSVIKSKRERTNSK